MVRERSYSTKYGASISNVWKPRKDCGGQDALAQQGLAQTCAKHECIFTSTHAYLPPQQTIARPDRSHPAQQEGPGKIACRLHTAQPEKQRQHNIFASAQTLAPLRIHTTCTKVTGSCRGCQTACNATTLQRTMERICGSLPQISIATAAGAQVECQAEAPLPLRDTVSAEL